MKLDNRTWDLIPNPDFDKDQINVQPSGDKKYTPKTPKNKKQEKVEGAFENINADIDKDTFSITK